MKANHFNLDDYLASGMGLSIYKGHYYGVTVEQDELSLYVNLDAFHAAGLKVFPKTTSELAADAVALTKKDASGRVTQLGLGGMSIQATAPYFNGSWYDAGHNQVTPDNPGVIQALTWEQGIVNKIGVQPYENFINAKPHNPIGDSWIDGDEAMSIDGDWMCALTGAYNKTMHFVALDPPYADGHPEWQRSTWIQGGINVIPTGAAHPNEAFQFLQFMDNTQSQVTLQTAWANTPVNKKALQIMNHGCLGRFISIASSPHALPMPILPVSGRYFAAVGVAEDSVLRGKATAQQAMAGVKQTIQAALLAASH